MAIDYPMPPVSDAQSVGELFSELTSELQVLLQKEVELAKIEVKDQAAKAAKAGAMFVATAVTVFLTLILGSFAAAWGLAEIVPTGVAFLVVTLVWAIVGGVCFSLGRKRLRQFHPVPEQTVSTLKKDVEVAKRSVSRGMHSPTDWSATNWSSRGRS
jgi:hypothetical protein